jgi:hypothetical protein
LHRLQPIHDVGSNHNNSVSPTVHDAVCVDVVHGLQHLPPHHAREERVQ